MKKNILKTVSEKIQHIWKKSDKLSVQDSKKAVSDPEKKIKESIQKKEDIQIEKARQRRWSDFDFDKTDGEAFEYFCADLLRANGFTNVELTKKTGDLGVDILAEKEQITYAVQCKCHASNIGNQAVRDVYSGKECYHCMIGAVMTNRFFTKAAVRLATEHNILLWDREYLFQLIKNAEKNVYEVGKDLDPGEYKIFGEREKRWKCTVSKDKNGKSVLFQIIAEGCYTVEIKRKKSILF